MVLGLQGEGGCRRGDFDSTIAGQWSRVWRAVVFHSRTIPPGNLNDSWPSSPPRFCLMLAGRSTTGSSASAAGTRRTRIPSTSESNTRQKTCQSTLRDTDEWRGRRGFLAGSCTLPKTRSRRSQFPGFSLRGTLLPHSTLYGVPAS